MTESTSAGSGSLYAGRRPDDCWAVDPGQQAVLYRTGRGHDINDHNQDSWETARNRVHASFEALGMDERLPVLQIGAHLCTHPSLM